MTQDLSRLSRSLGYKFRDPSLLCLAMTHRSVSRLKNYERLEFLGDSIINFLIADALFQRFPDANEGQLSRLRAELVRGQTLAALARGFSIGDYLVLGSGELKSGGYRRDSILADAMESVIGAIYLDAGIEACRERVQCWFAKRLEETDVDALKDAKTRLQEALQSFKFALPVYVVKSAEGEPHNQVFTVECAVPGIEFIADGHGSSRRKAEQEAALSYLRWVEKRGMKNISLNE